jgi:CheY-like chemotaxis protein
MLGFLSDLTRSLTALLIHIDNLLSTVEPNNKLYGEIWLANEQIGQALKSLINLRELSLYQDDVREKTDRPSTIELSHDLNECLTVIQLFNDCINNYNYDKQLYEIIKLTYNSIQNLIRNYTNTYNSKNHTPYKESFGEPIECIINNNEISTKIENIYKILIIEDNNDIRNIVSIALANKGYLLIECDNAKTALGIFTKEYNCIKLAIIDIKLPDMNGTELANKLLSVKSDLNIIYITGCDEEYLRKSFKFNQSYSFILKPFRLEQIINKVEWAMSLIAGIMLYKMVLSGIL